MVYDDEDRQRSRVVIETPSARREEVRTVTARGERRRGIHPGTVAALVIGSVALVTVLFLLILNRQPQEDTSVTTTSTTDPALSQPVVIQQPTPLAQPPIIIQQPGTVTTQPPIIIEQPAPATVPPSAPAPGADDSRIQSEIDKRMAEDSVLSTAAVTATVVDGKVTLIGTVDSAAIKNRVEGLVRALRGVKAVDSQIIVSAG